MLTSPPLVTTTAAHRLTVHLERQFTREMDRLRRDGWGACQASSTRDEFDDESVYVVVSDRGRPVGMVRVTLADRSVLGTWSNGQAPLPRGRDVAELTRGVVDASMRRLGLYRLAMLETILSLRALGIRLATAAIAPELPARRFLAELGFRPVGAPILFDDHPRTRTLAQPIILALDAHEPSRWDAMRGRQVDWLFDAGYVVESEPLSFPHSTRNDAALV